MAGSKRGSEVVAWIEKHASHVKGEWAGRRLKLEPWQATGIIEPLFGTLRPDGLRQYRTALIGVPRKAGKSTMGAAMALRLLFGDGEPGAEVFSAAADREQAAIVFEIARGMVEANPAWSKAAKVYRRSIVLPSHGRVYKVLSADAYTKHGLSPHGVIFDELHAQPNRELWDVLTTGQGARRQPLTVAITTAGYDKTSICYELYDYGQKVNAGIVEDPSFFFRWWGVEESDDWEDEETWARAQPNLGVSVSLDFLRTEARQAKHQPARQNTFRRLYLNQWTSADVRWLDLGLWDENAGVIDEAKLVGRECFGGLDLASTSDFTAWVLVFPGDPVEVLARFFLPRAALEKRTAMRPTLEVWEREGFLTVTDGDVVDYDAVFAQVDADARRFSLREVAHDPWNATDLVRRIDDAGMTVWPLQQTVTALSPACKELERLLGARKLRHGGNPILRWMADNVMAFSDSAGNIKPDRKKSTEKIDGIAALVDALSALMRDGGDEAFAMILGG